MVEDKELIRQYAAEKSEAAFAELVQRHLSMVYAAALRQVNGDAHLAQDLAQTVFSELAAKAALLRGANSIAGWLYTHTRFAAVKAVRTETRRRVREQAVFAMNETNSPTTGWNELRPLLDEALSELGETDREAIVLRFFESYEFSRVGAALGVSENAARMRVDRALEKLRAALQKRGLPTTSAVLAGLLAETPPAAVSAQLAAGITGAALRHAAASSPSTTSLIKLITMKKTSLVAAGALALSLAAVVALRSSPDTLSPTAAPPAPNSRSTTLAKSDATGQTADPKPDSDPFQNVVRRHDEQLKAHPGDPTDDARARWEKEVADFDDSMKDEPGVKKFGRKIQQKILPGQSLIVGVGETAPGKALVVYVRPKLGDDQTQASGGLPSGQLVTRFPVITIDSRNLAGNPDGNVGNYLGTLSEDQANEMFGYHTNQPASAVIGSPSIAQRFGMDAGISVGTEETIAGRPQHLGLKISYFPTRAADGVSLDLGMLVRYIVPTTPPSDQ